MSAEQNPVGTAEVQAAAEGAKLLLAVREWIAQDPDQNDRCLLYTSPSPRDS